jgi:putative ABC transport system permease protein
MFGGVFGIAIGWLALSLMTHTAITGKSVVELATFDLPMVLYGFAVAIGCSLLFGMAPAIQLLRSSQTAAMARGSRRGFQHVFIAAQVAAALVLLIGTGLLMKSLWTVENIAPGFDPEHLTTASLIRPKGDPTFIDRLTAAIQHAPGVESAALSYPLPFTTGGLTSGFVIEGREHAPGAEAWHGEAWFVSPNYFETMRIPLLRGRTFAPTDAFGAPRVCIIDEHLATHFFPGEDPLGHSIGMYNRCRIVGVARNVRGGSLEEPSRATVYYVLNQIRLFAQSGVVVRSARPAGPLIRDIVRRTNGSSPVFDIRSMSDRIDESLGVRRVMALLVCAFAGICILLAAIGLHGVVAQVVGERAPEIGVRMALGARPQQIRAQFLRYGLKPGAAGLVLGLGAALFAQRWLTGLLYEVKPFDPLTIAAACGGILFVLVWAVFWPARRASRIDPQSVLRHE